MTRGIDSTRDFIRYLTDFGGSDAALTASRVAGAVAPHAHCARRAGQLLRHLAIAQGLPWRNLQHHLPHPLLKQRALGAPGQLEDVLRRIPVAGQLLRQLRADAIADRRAQGGVSWQKRNAGQHARVRGHAQPAKRRRQHGGFIRSARSVGGHGRAFWGKSGSMAQKKHADQMASVFCCGEEPGAIKRRSSWPAAFP